MFIREVHPLTKLHPPFALTGALSNLRTALCRDALSAFKILLARPWGLAKVATETCARPWAPTVVEASPPRPLSFVVNQLILRLVEIIAQVAKRRGSLVPWWDYVRDCWGVRLRRLQLQSRIVKASRSPCFAPGQPFLESKCFFSLLSCVLPIPSHPAPHNTTLTRRQSCTRGVLWSCRSQGKKEPLKWCWSGWPRRNGSILLKRSA